MDLEKLEQYEDLIERHRGNRNVFIVVPEDRAEPAKRKNITYKSLNLTTGRSGVAPADQVEEIRGNYKEMIEFKSRGARFGEIDAICKNRKWADEMAMRKLRSERWVFFPTYMGKKIVRVRMEKITLELDKEGALAVIFNEMKETKIIQVSHTNLVEWWGYGTEVF